MENENVNENEMTTEDFIKEVNELKENTVSKDEYQKVLDDKKKLMSALINGDTTGIDLPDTKNTPDDLTKRINENVSKLRNGEDLSDIEYWKLTLQVRDDVIERDGKDPFLPNGHEYILDSKDAERAEAVATIVQECIDYAEGDNTAFMNELMRRTKDTGPKNFKK